MSVARVALDVTELRKAFGATTALDTMSWSAPAGAVTALLGPNGAGKTTAMRCIAGVLTPDSGTIEVLGRRERTGGHDAISFLPEQPELYPALTVAEHLRFIALAHRLDGSWRDRADDLLCRFGLSDRTDEVPGNLSQGQRRKAAIVVALLHGAEVLLFDEPFNGLDPGSAAELRDVLVDLARDGAAVVVSTHVLAAAERFVDRAVIVDAGREVAQGAPSELRQIAGVAPESDLEGVFLALTGRRPDAPDPEATSADPADASPDEDVAPDASGTGGQH